MALANKILRGYNYWTKLKKSVLVLKVLNDYSMTLNLNWMNQRASKPKWPKPHNKELGRKKMFSKQSESYHKGSLFSNLDAGIFEKASGIGVGLLMGLGVMLCVAQMKIASETKPLDRQIGVADETVHHPFSSSEVDDEYLY
ncbi:MAG: hypothetical protein OHK0017_07170 [Patescibacteria group bacterium]